MDFRSKKKVNTLLNSLPLYNGFSENFGEVTSLKTSLHEGTFPAIIISCKMKSGEELLLHLKHTSVTSHQSDRNGIEYEGRIYNEILKEIALSTPKYYVHAKEKGTNLLLIEHLENCLLIKHASPEAFVLAAKWIANFHLNFSGKKYPFVQRYDMKYFTDWVDRAEKVTNSDIEFKWIHNLCLFFRENLPVLLNGTETLIHGEYYGKNILIRNNTIYPVDWEACAYGPQEVDLAALIDGKDTERNKLAIEGYKSVRYPDGIPEDFELRLTLAELYFKFRWIAEWIKNKKQLASWISDPLFSGRLYKIASENGCI